MGDLADQEWSWLYDHIYETDFGDFYREFTMSTVNIIQKYLDKGTVIDYGAGTGRLSIPLRQLGYSVISVEMKPAMAYILEKKAEEMGLDIPVHVCSIEKFQNGTADMALCLFRVLNQIIDYSQMKRSLEVMTSHLTNGGYLFIDLPNDAFFNVGQILRVDESNYHRMVSIIPIERPLYILDESSSGRKDGVAYEFDEKTTLRKWRWDEIDLMLEGLGMVILKDEFPEMIATNSKYKMYKKSMNNIH
jgi:SAM-dependent methyltransferase